MSEIKDCLPDYAKKNFLDRRNIRQSAQTAQYQAKLREIRVEAGRRGLSRSGWRVAQEWALKEQLSETLATGFVEDAIDTIRLYEIPFTAVLRDCLEEAIRNQLVSFFKNAFAVQGLGVDDVKMPNSAAQQMSARIRSRQFEVMPRIRVRLETAMVEEGRGKATFSTSSRESRGDVYYSISQSGGVMNASIHGNVTANQATISLDQLQLALGEMRANLKQQDDSVESDEHVGILESAEKAAAEKDETTMLRYLKQVPSKVWDVGKVVIPQVLLEYLKTRHLA